MGIIMQKALTENLDIDVMTQLSASVLKTPGGQDCGGIDHIACSVGGPNYCAVLRASMTVTAVVPGGHPPGDVVDEVTLTLPSQRPMIFQDSEVEMQLVFACCRRLSITLLAKTRLSPECAKMLRDVIFRAQLNLLLRALLRDPTTRKQHAPVRYRSGARVVRSKPPPERNRLP